MICFENLCCIRMTVIEQRNFYLSPFYFYFYFYFFYHFEVKDVDTRSSTTLMIK